MPSTSYSFEDALKHILIVEGPESDDPNDAGGHTKYGIAAAKHGKTTVSHLTLQRAAEIYREEYWDELKLDRVEDGPTRLTLFDCAVLHGPTRTARWLQEIVGASIDGAVGPQTLGMLAKYGDYEKVRALITLKRVRLVTELAYRRPNQRRFLLGWLRRILLVAP